MTEISAVFWNHDLHNLPAGLSNKRERRVKRVFQKAADLNNCLFRRLRLSNSMSLHVSFTLIKYNLIDATCKSITCSMYFPYQIKTHNIQYTLEVPATETLKNIVFFPVYFWDKLPPKYMHAEHYNCVFSCVFSAVYSKTIPKNIELTRLPGRGHWTKRAQDEPSKT